MTLMDQFRATVAAYTVGHPKAGKGLSFRLFDDSKRLNVLMTGRGDMTLSTFERAMAWFSANWPDGVEWPSDVPRPLPEFPAASGLPESPPSLGVSSLTGPGANAGPAFPEAAE